MIFIILYICLTKCLFIVIICIIHMLYIMFCIFSLNILAKVIVMNKMGLLTLNIFFVINMYVYIRIIIIEVCIRLPWSELTSILQTLYDHSNSSWDKCITPVLIILFNFPIPFHEHGPNGPHCAVSKIIFISIYLSHICIFMHMENIYNWCSYWSTKIYFWLYSSLSYYILELGNIHDILWERFKLS